MSLDPKTAVQKGRIPARDKAEQTTVAARSIIDAEAASREKKTARLKELRLQHEAQLAAEASEAEAPAKPKGKAKAARR